MGNHEDRGCNISRHTMEDGTWRTMGGPTRGRCEEVPAKVDCAIRAADGGSDRGSSRGNPRVVAPTSPNTTPSLRPTN